MRGVTIPDGADLTYPAPDFKRKNLNLCGWFKAEGNDTSNQVQQEHAGKLLRCEKVRLFPTPAQAKKLHHWAHLCNIAYNGAVKYIRVKMREHQASGEKSKFKIPRFSNLRENVKQNFSAGLWEEINRSGILVHILDESIRDVTKAYKSAFALSKITKKRFRIRYKKAGAGKCIVIPREAFSKVSNAFAVTSLGVMDSSVSIVGTKKNSRLQIEKANYCLYVPKNVSEFTHINRKERLSLDPGVRTFQTAYDNSGDVYEFGAGCQRRIEYLFSRIDKVSAYQGARWYKKYTKRLYDKIKHLVNDMHWKTASHLVKNFDEILIGNMSTSSILRQEMRPMTKRVLQALSHYTFRLRLKAKCEQHSTNFAEVDERYTSKTCGRCGVVKEDLGSSKTFACGCGWNVDRDANAARNIMIKHDS